MTERLSIQVVDDEEAEAADLMVCARMGDPTPFTDNVEAVCADCGHAIIHRPHAPKAPPKICVECAILRIEGSHGH